VTEDPNFRIVFSVDNVSERAAHSSVWEVSLDYSAIKCSIIDVSLFIPLLISTANFDCVGSETLFFNSNF